MIDWEPTYTVVFLPHDGREPWRRDNLTLELAVLSCEREAVEGLLVVRGMGYRSAREVPWWPLLNRLGLAPLTRPCILGHIDFRGVSVIGYIPPLLPPTSWERLLEETGL